MGTICRMSIEFVERKYGKWRESTLSRLISITKVHIKVFENMLEKHPTHKTAQEEFKSWLTAEQHTLSGPN